uniref:Ankyrin repeat protein n=1 Tax=Pithovirus LCPAC403 TaxID=2506596 RepID=A0A481ZB47_9VIRU|nr:MAG: uncharacterized protein LCPAC403_02870 [Pithovirus LCPAC403]
MECKCNALEVVKKKGGKHVDELLKLYNNRSPRSFINCSRCFKKPAPFWIWESLAKEALLKGLANTDVLRFIESKKIHKYYNPRCLKASAAAGHLDSIQHILNYGLDPTAHEDCNWEDFEKYETLVINMWKKVLKRAVDTGHDSGELFEYLELMVKISEVDADIAFIEGKVSIGMKRKSGISELKMILEGKIASIPDILRKKREKRDRKRMHEALKVEYGGDYPSEESKSDN